jgi:tRNA uridine 5-carbamoylmethylation protein Kti12
MRKALRGFIVLMGLPSSGKTTIARLLAQSLHEKYGFPSIVIGTDDVRRLIPQQAAQFDPTIEPFIKSLTLNIIDFCLKNDYLVINDDMNYYKSMRHELKQIAEENRAHFILFHIQIPLEIALEWNQNRGLPIPQEVIRTVYERFDAPADYQWDVPLLTIQSNETSWELAKEEILAKVIPIIASPFEPKMTQPAATPGINEKIDKITRDIVAGVARATKDPALLKKISKFRIDYIKNLNINEISSENIGEDFSEKLNLFLKNIKPAK